MKKIISFIMLFILTLVLIGCNNQIISFDNTTISTKFINKSDEYQVENKNIDLHYFNDVHLPFVDVVAFVNLLDGVYISELFEYLIDDTKDVLTINIELTDKDTNDLYTYEMVINALQDSIYVDSMDFFYSYLVSTETNYGEGLIYLDPIITAGSATTYDLGLFDFDIIKQDDAFLMPLAIANLFFNQGNYFDVYYNGRELYGIDTSDSSNSKLNSIIKSTYNNKIEPLSLKEINYNFYLLLLNYFYGLKDIISLEDVINKESFLMTDSNESIYNVTNNLDELHSSYISKGFYNNSKFRQTYEGIPSKDNVNNFYTNLNKIAYNAASAFGTTVFGYLKLEDLDYYYVDNTLIIYLLDFNVDTPVGIESIIKNAPSSIDNIIIDLSLNTGGNLGAVLRMFTLFTEQEVWYHSINPLDGEKSSYGVIGEGIPYSEYNYYIKTSSITFSAANLTASIAKELNIKVIGNKSSGGASGVGFFVFPNGAIINLSSNFVLTDKDYNSIEYGISPNIVINEIDMFDHNKVVAAINK